MTAICTQSTKDAADLLPMLVQAAREIVDVIGVATEAARRSGTLPTEAADTMVDLGEALIDHSRTLMREVWRRKREVEVSAPELPPASPA